MVLVLLSTIFVLVLVVLLLIIGLRSPVVSSPEITCNPGDCLTNIYNGLKTCPSTPNGILSGDILTNVCNPPFFCTDEKTPYAVQNDQSTDPNGTCPAGIQCRCLSRPQCADYITAYFTYENGNPYLGAIETIPGSFDPFAGQRLIFKPNTSYTDLALRPQTDPPLQLENQTSMFCAIPNSWLPRMAGGCPNGILAYLPPNPETFNSSQLNITPVGCVRGSPCPTGNIAYWNLDQVSCLNS